MNRENVLIVANDIGGMHEQINDGVDAVIDNITLQDLVEKQLEQASRLSTEEGKK